MPPQALPERHPLDPLWRTLRFLRAALTVGLYLIIAPSGFLPYGLFCLFHRGTPEQRARVLQRISSRGVRIMHWWLRTVRVMHFDWRDVHLQLPDRPCVIVANHPTQLDPTALMAVLVHACTLVKPTVWRRKFVGPLLSGAWHFEGPSLDPTSIAHVLENAGERLRAGMHLFVFPEGTRSTEGQLGEFGRIAFEIACRTGAPVVSLALSCEPCYLSRQTPLWRPPARLPRLRVKQLAIDDPLAHGGDSRALRNHVEQRYRAWLAAGMPTLATASRQTVRSAVRN